MAARPRGPVEGWFWKSTQNLQTIEGAAVNGNEVPIFGDNTWHDAWPTATDTPVPYPFDYGWGDKGTTGEMNQFCIDRHNGWTNLAFADWSVRHCGLKELWTLRWNRNYNITRPLDQSRGRDGRGLAPVAAEIQGLLTRTRGRPAAAVAVTITTICIVNR